MRFSKALPMTTAFLLVGVGATNAHAAQTGSENTKQTLTAALSEVVVPGEQPEIADAPQPTKGEQLLSAALSQVGIAQDCTDLVQNALAALGYTARRDQGGFDFGVQDVGYTFGVPVPANEAQPGDIAVIGPNNGGHVWVILDPHSAEGVHGGWNGSTVVGSNGVPIASHTIYRLM